MSRLRTRLIAIFLLATALPLGLTLWTTLRLLDRSLDLAPLKELSAVTRSLEQTGGEFYRQSRELLRRDAGEGRVEARPATAAEAEALLERGVEEAFEVAGEDGRRLDYLVRRGDAVVVYSHEMGVPMDQLSAQIGEAKQALERQSVNDIRGGFSRTFLAVTAALWLAALAVLVFLAARISKPVQQLTHGLRQVATGDLHARVPETDRSDEIGEALGAFNSMARQLERAREDLIQVTRLASWQALARKMAHEVKNSLTPIRLTMEEIVSRNGNAGDAFLEQAAQIVADEVNTLERRVRAFSEFAAEPPVAPAEVDVDGLVGERIALLKSAHPQVTYRTRLGAEGACASADPDLVKGILTNLLENAAQASQAGGSGGEVMAATRVHAGRVVIEIEDNGPGLSPQAAATLFEPTISFKKGGMGLGLSIAHRSATLCGGELRIFAGELGGAGFRLTLPEAVMDGRNGSGVAAALDRHKAAGTTSAEQAGKRR